MCELTNTELCTMQLIRMDDPFYGSVFNSKAKLVLESLQNKGLIKFWEQSDGTLIARKVF